MRLVLYVEPRCTGKYVDLDMLARNSLQAGRSDPCDVVKLAFDIVPD